MKNGYTYKRKWLFLMGWTLWSSWVQAQPNLAFYPLNDQFNSFDYNPAFLTSAEKFTFSIFPLAGTSLSYNNQDIVKDVVSKFLSGEVTNEEYEEIFNRMLEHSSFHQNIESSYLSFTYRSKVGFWNFRIKDRQYMSTSVNGELMDFIFKPDIYSVVISKKQRLPVEAAHYREYSLGYSHTSRDKRLSVGARAKLYYGKFAFYSDIEGSIEKFGSDHGLITSGVTNISFPENTIETGDDNTSEVDFSAETISNYFWNSGNPGVGVDLGISYQLNPKVSLSLSVIDLGKITWKNNLNSRKMEAVFRFPLDTYRPILLEGVPTITKRENYTYSNSIDFFDLSRDRSSFSKALPAYIYAGLKYQVNPSLSISITDRYAVIKNLNYNSLALTANFEVNKKFSVSTGYSMIDDSYFNLPLALLFKRDFGQIFVGSDNLVAFVLPSQADFASISFGACFYLFRYRNLLLKRSELTPFYQPRKTIKNRGSGLIIKARKKDK